MRGDHLECPEEDSRGGIGFLRRTPTDMSRCRRLRRTPTCPYNHRLLRRRLEDWDSILNTPVTPATEPGSHSLTLAPEVSWIPASAGMTDEERGMTDKKSGMTAEKSGKTDEEPGMTIAASWLDGFPLILSRCGCATASLPKGRE